MWTKQQEDNFLALPSQIRYPNNYMDTPEAAQKVEKKVEELLSKVDTVIDQQKELAEKQEVILDQVAVEEKEEETVVTEVEKVESVSNLQQNLITRAKHHKLLFPLLIFAGVVLVWRGLTGIFDATPVISYSFISLAIGIIILWIFNRMNLF